MKAIVIAALLLLTGCVAKVVEYKALPITQSQAESIIEQVLMEQPLKTRPEQVFFTDEYIGYGSGTISATSGFASATPIGVGAIAAGSSKTSSKAVQTRIYFNSIGSVTLYSKRGRWVVQTRNQAGGVLNSSQVDTQQKAQRFVDAMLFFKRT
ncbi:hypothetical protein EDF83_3264 [Pseudomonas protegens]|jgi:hypothetical protein|uniref:Uncharacterized protein n=2 Tax=Pseudomonas protegens TaxID=380021 RepID=A0A2C9ELL1_PSEPH|nr:MULTISPECIES: hypothetical protein [Pseudomonas]BFD41623.1 hypothetical protein FFPRI1PSEUD_31220 [Pseudomonas sp. FFPRI_1]AGL84525.1 hypothetical protein PFLCHA0_c27540 [Pseudomonas protegens CHA0]MBP5113261.1 hypothetical protein [Pseudomonas protegens]MCS4259526.1 hypothetical protein [Pseudomonas sp. BIGb0176]MCU1769705.1 hypothetical protein [Pseudomonas protegens]